MKRTLILGLILAFASGIFTLVVEGVVTDSDTEEGIEGADVRFIFTNTVESEERGNGNGHGHGQGSSGGNGYNVYSAVTDADGAYNLEDLPEGIYNVLIKKSGSYPAVRIGGIVLSEDTVMDFQLIPGNCEPPPGRILDLLFGKTR